MRVSELILALQELPEDLSVMVHAEGGIDFPHSVHVITAIRHSLDWSGTPVGQYREVSDWSGSTEEPFQVVLIGLSSPCQRA